MAVFIKGNRWYSDHYVDGQRKRKSIGHIDKLTRTEAEKIHKVIVSEIVLGKYNIKPKKKPVLFDKLCEHYLDWAKTNHKAYWRDEQVAKVLLKEFAGKLVTQINSWDVERYKKERKALGRKPGTINRELTVLKRMFNLGFQWELVNSNPVKGVKFMEVPKVPYHTLEDQEFENMYKLASENLKPFLLCAYSTGLRRGELLNLKWESVDFINGYIYVKETKNNEARAIPINEMDLLKEKLIELEDINDGEYVFQYYKDRSLTTLYRDFWRAIKKAGVKSTIHTLRHTFASNLVTRFKEDMITVMELTGHKDIRMLKRYSHTKEEFKKQAISKLGNHIKSLDLDTTIDTSSDTSESHKNSNHLSTIA
ncbi:site-specific integrase [Desulfobacterota bacterium AH_259_B03_O07]|nr:site-specific integrase [Desulfobacterota bacterium AH_259_B03_O07]